MPQNYDACSPQATPPTQFVNNTPGTLGYAIGFPYLAATDIVVFTGDTGDWTLRNQGTAANEYAVNPQNGLGTDQVVFTGTTPGANILIIRRTDLCEAARVFQAGASIRAEDLNTDMNQLRFLIQELYSWLEAFVGNEGDEIIPGELPDLGDLGDVNLSGDNPAWLRWNGTEWEDQPILQDGDAWVADDNHLVTSAAGDDRWLNSTGGDIVGGPGITVTEASGTVTIGVDLHGTTPGLELDGAGNAAELRALGNSVNTVGTDVQLVNGPSNVTVTGGGGITVTRNSDTEFTIAATAGGGGLEFIGTVDVSVAPPAFVLNGTAGQAVTVSVQCLDANVNGDWDTLLRNWNSGDGNIDAGDVLALTADGDGTVATLTNDVDRIAVGGGVGTLQQVTTAGNETTLDIEMMDGAGVIFQNDAQDQTVELNADDCTQSYTVTLPPVRPTAVARYLRSTGTGVGADQELEWAQGGGGATGGLVGANQDRIFWENGNTVNNDYTVGTTFGDTANCNAMSAGPITIDNGVTVTIENGSNWIVL